MSQIEKPFKVCFVHTSYVRNVKDSESTLLTNVLVSFTVKYFLSREKNTFKKLVPGSSSGIIVESSFTVNGLKGISAKFGSGVI